MVWALIQEIRQLFKLIVLSYMTGYEVFDRMVDMKTLPGLHMFNQMQSDKID